jgi:hypothetical protein
MNFTSLVLEALGTPSITNISRMEDDEIPDWVLDNKTYYHLTINGKKCYFSFKYEDSCMLYVDGYKRPGFDFDNAIYDYNQYMKLFDMEPSELDPYIIKAIKNWEYKQKLTPDTLNTFGDLIDEL